MADRNRVCAGCGYFKRIYFQYRDPNRSLCCLCYVKPELHSKFGRAYRGPILDPPHPQVLIVNDQETREKEARARTPTAAVEARIPDGRENWHDQYRRKWEGRT